MYSFKKQKKQNEVHGFLRRLIDTSSPNLNRLDGDDRWQGRCNRTFPVLLVPFEDKLPVPADAVFALTKNLSSQGAAFVLQHPLRAKNLLIVFSVESSRMNRFTGSSLSARFLHMQGRPYQFHQTLQRILAIGFLTSPARCRDHQHSITRKP